jgi:hypothetical protein
MTFNPFDELGNWKDEVDADRAALTALREDEVEDDRRVVALTQQLQDALARLARLEQGGGEDPGGEDPGGEDPDPDPVPVPTGNEGYIISHAEIKARPVTNYGGARLFVFADRTWELPRLEYLNARGDTEVVAGAMAWVITGEQKYYDKVVAQLRALPGTKLYRTLEAARGLQGYVIAAGLIGFKEPAFMDYIAALIFKPLSESSHSGQRTLWLLARNLWNNWSMHGRAAVLLTGMHLKAHGTSAQQTAGQQMIDMVLESHKYLLGIPIENPWPIIFPDDPVEWLQGDPIAAVVVKGTRVWKFDMWINLSGVLPLDRLRGSYDIRWPPVKTGYNAEGAQGLVTTAVVLHRAGLLAFTAADNAMVRVAYAQYGMGEAATNTPVHFEPFVGDDAWLPFYINHYAGLKGTARIPENVLDLEPSKGGVGHGRFLFGPDADPEEDALAA